MPRILISSCLLGRPVRYNGSDKPSGADEILQRWQSAGWLVALCPEISVGFPTPRPPAEISRSDGHAVLDGVAHVLEDTGADVTHLYQRAAHETVAFAKRNDCTHAVLSDGSPSCGSTFIYDGTFSGATKPGVGSTTAALKAAGIAVWPETKIADLDTLLQT